MILSSYEAIREAHSHPLMGQRAQNIISDLYKGTPEGRGISFNHGKVWRELRAFYLKSLKNFGSERESIEDNIMEECERIIKYFEDKGKNKAHISLTNIFNKVALNIVWKIIAGERFDYEDQKLDELMQMIDSFNNVARTLQASPLALLPILRHLPPFKSVYRKSQKGMSEVKAFISRIIEEHRQTFDKDNLRDYIDSFIHEMEGPEKEIYNEENLLISCFDLFIAGSETSSKSLMFFLSFLVLYPDVQKRIYQELSLKVPDRNVRAADIPNLPFCSSVMIEIWRLMPIVPMDVPRFTNGDIKIQGFDIPNGTEVWSNYFAANMDEKSWEQPHLFKPERHMQSQNTHLAFGLGRRRCLGEDMAKTENTLIFCNLVKHFQFEAVPGEEPSVSLDDCTPALTIGPKPFKVIALTRE